jgi:hypothetical protein
MKWVDGEPRSATASGHAGDQAGFLLAVQAGALRYYSAASSVTRWIDVDTKVRLLSLAQAAIADEGSVVDNPDTAAGRYVSSLVLEVTLERTELARLSFNHYSTPAARDKPAWGALISCCAEELMPDLGEAERGRWRFLLRQF